MTDDPSLRSRFAALRDEETALHVPLFGRLAASRERPVFPLARVVAAIALLFVLGAVVFSARRGRLDPAPQRVAMPQWDAPTDFLLQTPGIELIRSTPQFGEVEPPMKGNS
ncbi:MAG TPA: hypothetical protein VIL97_01785 [Thermoanaerobaculia bacterium]